MTTLVSDRPDPRPTAEWTFPAVSRTTASGVTVVSAHLTGRPMVRLSVVVDAGCITDPPGLEGMAQVAAASLSKGARGLDEEDLAIAFETVGATPGGSAGFDSASVNLSAPAGLLAEAAALLADMVRRPTLDTTEVERVVEVAIDSLAAARSNPQFVADRAARAAYFAPDSRFRFGGSGSQESLRAIDADAVRAFHAARWAAAPLTVVVVGDLTGVDLDAIAGAFSTDANPVPTGATSASIAGGGRRIVLADMPGAVQSVLDFTAPGPKYAIADAAELNVAQAVVVAAFSARVNQRLREELGYTYGASGSFARHRDGGTLNLGTQVRNEVTADAIREAIAVFEGSVGDRPLTDDEVEQARDNLVAKFAVQYDGARSVAGAVVNRVVHGLDDDERDVMLTRLMMVQTDQANDAWRKYVNLDELVVTVAGDAAAVRPSLEALGMPIVEADGGAAVAE